MAGEYLPPVVLRVTADIDGLISKLEAAQAKVDEFEADMATKGAAMKGEQEAGTGGTYSGGGALLGRIHGVGDESDAAARYVARFSTGLRQVRQDVTGPLQSGLQDLTNNLKALGGSLQAITGGIGGIVSGFGSLGTIFTGPLGLLGSVASFAKQWAVMVPTLFAAPALLGAIAGAAGGLAGSFTVLATAAGLFAAGAMTDLGLVTSVSTMAQFDALSAPLQKLYYAYHNLSNEWTIMTQTMGQTTIIAVLTNMFTTFQQVLTKIAPVMGEIAVAGQSAFNVLAGGLLGSKFTTFIDWVGSEATPVLTTFSQTFVNMAEGWTSLMEDLTPAITLFDNGMVSLTQTFANWAASPKGESQVQGFIAYIQKAWPDISKFWGGLGNIFKSFFSSAAKNAPAMAADLGSFFDKIAKAIPTLTRFANTVLPGIVKGFGAFTGGFFQGLSKGLNSLLEAFSGKNGPNWHEIGDTVGKLAADFLKMLPPLTSILGQLVKFGEWVTQTIPGGLTTIIGLWVTLRGLVAGGMILSGLAKFGKGVSGVTGLVEKLLIKMGLLRGATSSISGAGGGAAGDLGGAAGMAGGLGIGGSAAIAGAAVIPAFAAFEVLTHTAKQNADAFTRAAKEQSALFDQGAGRVGALTLAGPSRATVNATHQAQGSGRPIHIENHVAMYGDPSPGTKSWLLQQLKMHDAELVRQLNMGRTG